MFAIIPMLDSSLLSSAPLSSPKNISVERRNIYEQKESGSNECSKLSRNILCRTKNE